MNVELVSVGTELLLGDIVNTNTAYLSKELANIGVNVFKHTTVGDNKGRLLRTFDRAFNSSDTVIVTGGLGPTDDDITKECAAEYFNRDFYLDNYSWEKIQDYVLKYSKNNVLTINNKKQAMIPNGAIVLENFCGTAPGIILEDNGRRIILMPGPPREMKDMFIKSVKPYLEKLSEQKFVSKYIRFYGIGESLLEDKIKVILDNQTNPTVALYAKTGEVLIRVTASGKNKEYCDKLVEQKIVELENLVGEYIYLIGDESIAQSQSELPQVVAGLLIDNGLTISLAESLTGGYLTSLLVQNSGISNSLKESIVSYSNISKINNLNVKEETIKSFGVVSEEVAYEMLKGLIEKTDTDIAISTTGYADGNIDAGLVYIGVYYKGEISIKKCQFNGDRSRVIDRVSKEALNEVRKIILENI
ncbi:competence/damage-inducible protein A [Gemella sp. GH3]|uniref:competence/damage-inducible protein A n=1 Tax=unclassified Gemella TaxID=2624949 RepID=UPI0015CF8FE5|nr:MULTISPECIES: competence/damage-inducible protein A [unclassified Gemella]MBF0713799.1 competence/damage-inducible protein A [Gemella sp. GH3.1]NYS50751.1 competence/damage-inducible protein A [Gemella sp. GH3]